MEEHERHILSLATVSPGWRAVYRRGEDVTTRPITAWALIEDEAHHEATPQCMVGIVVEDGHTAFADQIGVADCRFCGYAGPGDDPHSVLRRSVDAALVEPAARSKAKSFASTWFG
jgi:hypothetical protein